MDTTSLTKKLEERLEQVDEQIKEGKIPFSSRVIPVKKALESRQWILPTAQAVEILRNSRVFALTDCSCRTSIQRCNNPVNVCFVVNDMADRMIKTGEAKLVSIEEAGTVLDKANEYGLVHLAIYNPEQHIFALCSCCPCCCHDLQILKKYQRKDIIAHADYRSETDSRKCKGCGICVNRCVFNVRILEGDTLKVSDEDCYGCGLCVTTCPEQAISMEPAGYPG